MSDYVGVSIGAVGAACIAAIISLIGLIVAKENKTSEFRQQWIDSLRESISDAIAAVSAMNVFSEVTLSDDNASDIAEVWRKVSKSLSLVELRLNVLEDDHQQLQTKIREAERLIKLAVGGEDLASELEALQDEVTVISQGILKREWDRVRAGEATFQLTKYALFLAVGLALLKWLYGQGV